MRFWTRGSEQEARDLDFDTEDVAQWPVAFSKYENDDVSQSGSMDSLLRLVRRSEAVFWELVEEKGMSAELVPAKAVDTTVVTTRTIGVFQRQLRSQV